MAELTPRLAARHDVHLFCLSVRDVDLSGVTIHRLGDLSLPMGLRALWFLLVSSLVVRPGRYDVVLSQGGNSLVSNFMLAHTTHCQRRRMRLQRQWLLGRTPLWRRAWEALRDRLFIAMEGRAARRCRGRVIAISRSVCDYFVRQWGLAPDEVHIARNGVDHGVFRPDLRDEARPRIRSQLDLAEDEFVALFVGGRWVDKGVPEIIAALPRTRTRPRLVVVGSGDRARFARVAQGLGVAHRVTFVGHVDRPQDYFAMADCLVHPNPIEPFGLVILEAAACGLPLLAARSGAALDLIEEGVTGYFVEREPDAIAAGLDRLAAPELRAAMRDAVHQRSLEFSWDRQADEIERLFLRLAEPAGAREGAR